MSKKDEWTHETLERFDSLFEKLQHNRQQVPLEVLQTKYAEPYKRLVSELTELADFFAECYFDSLSFPTHPKDTAGNEWLEKKTTAIRKQEQKPGGLQEQYRKALIEDLDYDKFLDLVCQIYDRTYKEAFDPYWQRHNRWAGSPGNRWIYNDIQRTFWHPPTEEFPDGWWMDNKWNFMGFQYPPRIGGNPDGGQP